MQSPKHQLLSEDGKNKVCLPLHCGGLCVQIPEAEHSSFLGPSNSYPSTQRKSHCELKANSPRGWLQFTSACGGRSNSPHSWTVGDKNTDFFSHCRLKSSATHSELQLSLFSLLRLLPQASVLTGFLSIASTLDNNHLSGQFNTLTVFFISKR